MTETTRTDIPLARADIGPAETAAVERVMSSGRLARGPEIEAFEQEFAAWHGVRGAVAMNSGTSALIAALRAVGVGPGDEVVMPALTFVGTANAILNCGAKPVLVDVSEQTWNLNPELLAGAVTKRTRAIVVVHLFGLVAAMEPLLDIARDRGIPLVEDACEAIGASWRGRRAGALADAGVFGFYPNKVLTTGEGGMLVSDASRVLEDACAIANQGRAEDGAYGVTSMGFSFRSTELAAALGRAQLASLDARLGERQRLAERYCDAFGALPVGLPPLAGEGSRSWFAYPVLLPRGTDRQAVMQHLASRGIGCADYFPSVHTLPGFLERVGVSGSVSVSERLGERLLCLPFWSGLEDGQMTTVVAELAAALKRA